MFRSLAVSVALTIASPAFAQTAKDQIVSALTRDGYTRIEESRTLLGRTRLVATDGSREREIVFSPRTGVIMRDLLRRLEDEDDDFEEDPEDFEEEGGEEEDGGEDDDEDDDDEDDDDEDDDDFDDDEDEDEDDDDFDDDEDD